MDTAGAYTTRKAVEEAVIDIKVSLLGDTSVGKTSVTASFFDKPYDSFCQATVCCELSSKYETFRNGDIVRFIIYDTAGQERFRGIMPNYVRNMDAVVLVYDVTNRASFENIDRWLHFVNNYVPSDVPVIIVGNKIDLDDEREVTKEEGHMKAEMSNSYFMEASAKTGEGIKNVFEHLALAIRERKMKELFCGAKRRLSSMALRLPQTKVNGEEKIRPCCGS